MNQVDYERDVCDFCERVVAAEGHTCEKMPIERLRADGRYLGYSDLVGCFGDILVEVSDDDYQGDTRYLLKDQAGRFGIVVNGWGSCSGCDALQACDTDKDFDELRSSLGNSAQWFDSAAECLGYLTGKDWEAHHSFREVETKRFVDECRAVLSPSDAEKK